jgi:hypothetical protein
MNPARKITVSVPLDLLTSARRITGRGVTATVVEALRELKKRDQRTALRALRGKVAFQLDLETTRR